MVSELIVRPSYGFGFSFSWKVQGGCEDLGPWEFTVEESVTTADNWHPVSPTLVGVFEWSDTVRRIPDKDSVLYFRVRFHTQRATYFSAAVAPWGTLNKREYLIAKDIMRREVLHARTLAGVMGSVWIKNIYGPRCTVCLDPITGTIRNSKCPVCFGTGYVPPYHGPYDLWFTFTPKDGKIELSEDGSGTVQPKPFNIRAIGTLPIRHQDVIIDRAEDKRYIVSNTKMEAELRRVPIVQTIVASEAATTDAVYQFTP